MRVLRGNFLVGLEDPQGLVLAPANGVIVPAGLVMGAGAALALAEAVPGARQALARAIEARGTRYPEGYRMYGLAVARAFQTKAHFRDNANAGIVRLSAGLLAQWMAAHPDFRVHLAYPGIGLGRLEPGLVERVLRKCLEGFQDRVFLYRL